MSALNRRVMTIEKNLAFEEMNSESGSLMTLIKNLRKSYSVLKWTVEQC